ncbi:MAG: transposase [Planctomycetia bacterium]|nr:transposase [Planctomycetia bacterium]MCC7316030.1 transposase [Planctomycetota bacterium]OQZ06148.1 MAG: hypothetical protein B6D36_06435 [Planctomycetes bacterium UTPLA1]
MDGPHPYRMWSRSRSVRLPGYDYREHAPYHITICAIPGSRPFDDEHRAEMVCRTLREYSESLRFYLAAYCLMPDHMHVLLSPAGSGLSVGQFIGRFKGKTTNESWKLDWRGPLWQPRFHDHIVRRDESIRDTARYIIENALKAGFGEAYPHRWADPDVLR